MVKSREEVLRIVREFRAELERVYGERLAGVYLYGSYARGDAHDDSDIDVAVVLDGPVNPSDERRRTLALWADISLDRDCLILPLFISREDHRDTPFAIHRNIVHDGVPA